MIYVNFSLEVGDAGFGSYLTWDPYVDICKFGRRMFRVPNTSHHYRSRGHLNRAVWNVLYEEFLVDY